MIANKKTNTDDILALFDKLMKNPRNLILLTDAYKYSHHKFYGKETTRLYSYLESRGGKFEKTLFFGLQIFLKKYLEGVAITPQDVDEADEFLATKYGVFGRDDVFDRSKFDYIVEKHGGKLPIIIKAVPEGTILNTHNILMSIENTDTECAWLTNFLESLLLQVWYTITVASLSREVRNIVEKYIDKTTTLTGVAREMTIAFMLNDFGFRGVSSVESAENGGMAHLVNFDGSDNVIASKAIIDFYNTKKIYGKSVPATEHSITTLKGEKGEWAMLERTLDLFPTGIVACVSDSFDIFKACSEIWGDKLRDKILSRPATPGNQLVIRPDSGHVLNTLREVFRILFDKFGYTINEKGYKVLPPQVRVIQGDGVNLKSIIDIFEMLDEEKISVENLALGMGGKLLQSDIDRDQLNFAFKAANATVDGEDVDIVKSPIEMDENGNLRKSFKVSKKGRMKLVKTLDDYETIVSSDPRYEDAVDCLVEVLNRGVITKLYTYEEVRDRANSYSLQKEAA